MTHYATRGAAIDRLLTRWDLEPGDVLAVNVYATDIVVHLRAPLAGIEWRTTPGDKSVCYWHDLKHEGLAVRLSVWVPEEAAA